MKPAPSQGLNLITKMTYKSNNDGKLHTVPPFFSFFLSEEEWREGGGVTGYI